MGLKVAILPLVTKDLPISPRFTPDDFLSRCTFSNLRTYQPITLVAALGGVQVPTRPLGLNSCNLQELWDVGGGRGGDK